MKRYTIYHDTDGVLATGKPYPTDEGAEIPGLDPAISLLEEVNGANPTIDPATQKLGGWGDRVYDTGPAQTATRTREVVALSAEEIAAYNRETKRETMRANWAGLPNNIKANYNSLFKDVSEFLDNNQDDLAVLAVQEVDPITAIAGNPTRLANFEATRTQFINAINNLSA